MKPLRQHMLLKRTDIDPPYTETLLVVEAECHVNPEQEHEN